MRERTTGEEVHTHTHTLLSAGERDVSWRVRRHVLHVRDGKIQLKPAAAPPTGWLDDVGFGFVCRRRDLGLFSRERESERVRESLVRNVVRMALSGPRRMEAPGECGK